MSASSEDQRLEEIMKDRDAVYGDASLILSNTGLAVTALLQQHYGIRLDHPIPPHIMCQIMTLVKVIRTANPEFHQDSYDDQINYSKLAFNVAPRNAKT